MILTNDLKAPGRAGGNPSAKKNKSHGSLTAIGKSYIGEISVAVIFYIFLSFGGENCRSLVIENFIMHLFLRGLYLFLFIWLCRVVVAELGLFTVTRGFLFSCGTQALGL